MTVIEHKPSSQIEALTPADIERMRVELDAIRQEVIDSRGARDARYIRRVITTQRSLELGARVVLLFSRNRVAWVTGVAALAVAKSLENMEIGHNVLHGQWDWMRDPKIHSTTWDWDHTTPPEQWKVTHNEIHHKYTNVLGKDNDLGYGIMRIDEDQEWEPRYLIQPVLNFFNACFFEWGITAYDLNLGEYMRTGKKFDGVFKERAKAAGRKLAKQLTKDYVVFPALSGRGAVSTLTANFAANVARNIWSHSVIMCGHFPEGVEVFDTESAEDETKGHWYLRQMLGSANISGPKVLHIMTGNLSHQIEHHLFPDLPSNRYAEVAPKVKAIFDRHKLHYETGSFPRQVASAWRRIIRLSLPNNFMGANKTPRAAAGQTRKAA
ncbi:MAG: acyl-CoA desaturase [Marmoricola sp.]